MDGNELPLDTRHPWVPSGCPKWFPCPWNIRRKLCTYLAQRLTLSSSRSKRACTWPRHLGAPSGVPKMIYEPMVHSTQIVHLWCIEINTISKWTETSFQFTHVTQEFHRVCPKRLPCPWCVRRKPYTYITPTLTLSPNGPKWVPLDPRHIGVPPRATNLSCVEINTVSK
jgi:hypothetical protein